MLLNGGEIERDLFWEFRGETAYRSGDWKLKGDSALYKLDEDRSELANVAAERPDKFNELLNKRESLLRTIAAP